MPHGHGHGHGQGHGDGACIHVVCLAYPSTREVRRDDRRDVQSAHTCMYEQGDGNALKAISSAVASDESSMKAADNGKTAKLREDKKDDQSAGAQVPHMI